MEKNSKIYIAGHTGLVGSNLLLKLKEEGYKNIICRGPEELDIRRQKETEDFFASEKPDYVFLAAAKVGGILANSTYTAEFIYDNLAIAANVIHASYLNGVKKLLNLGSSCIYPRLAPQPIKEESLLTGALEPTNEPYAIAKIAAIKLCRYYNQQYGTDFISVMPTNLYGPGDNFNLETAHVLPALIRKFHLAKLLAHGKYNLIRKDFATFKVGFEADNAAADASDKEMDDMLSKLGVIKNTVSIWGDGGAFREFLYIDDLANACIFLMERYGYREIGEFINIGAGQDLLIRELASIVREVVGFDGQVKYDKTKQSGTPRKLLESSRIYKLGWKPHMNLRGGIEKEYSWYLDKTKGVF